MTLYLGVHPGLSGVFKKRKIEEAMGSEVDLGEERGGMKVNMKKITVSNSQKISKNIILKRTKELDIVVHACNPSARERQEESWELLGSQFIITALLQTN